MLRIHLPNLMFEEELTDSLSRTTTAARRLVAELGPVMGLLTGPDDSTECIVLVSPESRPDDVPSVLEHVRFESLKALESREATSLADADFVPWGWSQQAIRTGRQLKLGFVAPNPAVVALINSRRFSAEFDFCAAMSNSQTPEAFGFLCSSMDEVGRSLKLLGSRWSTDKWIIKANHSHAARNRLIGNGPVPDPPGQSWLRQRFQAGEVVYAEPWVEPIAECGLQFTVPQPEDTQQQPQYDGATEMLTDAVGRYRGSILRPAAEDLWWRPAIGHCTLIAERAKKLGFFGTLGMDCMAFRHPSDGNPWLRVCHDINGRHTMGRVALSLNRFLQAGETGLWCHVAAKSSPEYRNLFDSAELENVRILQTSPSWIGSQPTRMRTALIISSDRQSLAQAAFRILTPDIRGLFSSLCGSAKDLRTNDNKY
jgi:hypothetical protein